MPKRSSKKRNGRSCSRGLDKVEHYVISRFPVIANDQRIICYNKINDLAELVVRRRGRLMMTKGESEHAIRDLCHKCRKDCR